MNQEKNVQPLRTKEEISEFIEALTYTGGERARFLFIFGMNTGLRISDIVGLRVAEVVEAAHVVIRERKTRKTKRFFIPSALRKEISRYTQFKRPSDWLFPSRRGDGHISTTQAYRILQKAADLLERDDIGTHTMRKTFGYWHYKENHDVAALQKIFNHSAPSITLRYIGIEADELDKTLEGFSLGI
jgi:integrase